MILWVVDGLQPATRTEREVLEAVCLEGQARIAIVSRLDLVDPDEREAILERVRQVLDSDSVPQGGDLRSFEPDLTAVLPGETSARRDLARTYAARTALAALEALPPLESRAEVGARLAKTWREHVKAVADRVADAVSPRAAERPAVAIREFATEATASIDPFLAGLADWPELTEAMEHPPAIPLPDAEPPTAIGIVAAAMGGEHRARARIREEAGRWMAEGLMALADWVADAPGIDRARLERESDRNALLQATGGESG